MADNGKCDCIYDEWLPCELHMTVHVSGAGSAFYTADEMAYNFIRDAISLGYVTSADDDAFLLTIAEGLDNNNWLDDEDAAQALNGFCNDVENTIDYFVHWDDGYTIFTINGGPLAE